MKYENFNKKINLYHLPHSTGIHSTGPDLKRNSPYMGTLGPPGGMTGVAARVGVGSKMGSVNLPIVFFLFFAPPPRWGVSNFRTLQGVSTP